MSESDFSRKRTRGTPTGSTPKQHGKRPSTALSTKKLSFSDQSTSVNTLILKVPASWTDMEDKAEDKALVEFILLSGKGDSWPTTINS